MPGNALALMQSLEIASYLVMTSFSFPKSNRLSDIGQNSKIQLV